MSKKFFDNLPELNLGIAKNRVRTDCVELNEALIREWVKELPENDLERYCSIYLAALTRFNDNQLDAQQRLILLDCYSAPLVSLANKIAVSERNNTVGEAEKWNELVAAVSELLLVLAMGYKIVVADAISKERNLKLNSLALMAVNRTVEQLGYSVMFAYKFYQSPPQKVFNELHQLYLLALKSNVEDRKPKLAGQNMASRTIKDMYGQLMLISICNPYGLAKGAVSKAYQIMSDIGSTIDIRPMGEDEKTLAGHFYINCLSDKPPTPSMLRKLDEQAHPPTLVLDTKPALVKFDLVFQRSQTADFSIKGVEIELLKQLAPYLNTSYERKQYRTDLVDEQALVLDIGLESVYQSISTKNSSKQAESEKSSKEWRVLNKNSSGYLISKSSLVARHDISVGDLVGVTEQREHQPVIKIGFIRWLKTNHHNVTKMGLTLIEGQPISVEYELKNGSLPKKGLFMPEVNRINQPASLISDKGGFSFNEKLMIKPLKKRFKFDMKMSRLLAEGQNFEHFSLVDDTTNH